MLKENDIEKLLKNMEAITDLFNQAGWKDVFLTKPNSSSHSQQFFFIGTPARKDPQSIVPRIKAKECDLDIYIMRTDGFSTLLKQEAARELQSQLLDHAVSFDKDHIDDLRKLFIDELLPFSKKNPKGLLSDDSDTEEEEQDLLPQTKKAKLDSKSAKGTIACMAALYVKSEETHQCSLIHTVNNSKILTK